MSRSINVVIVTYNNKELLDRCIASVQESLREVPLAGTVTVVDNNSEDGTGALVQEKFSRVHYLRNNENLGTARAFNRGISAHMNADFTMLMNDDVELYPGTLGAMTALLDRHPEAAGVPAYPISPNGRPQRVKLRIFGVSRVRDNRIRRAAFGGTTACLYRTEVFRKAGMFDEFYFFYNEDLDLSLRVKRAGMRFVFDPSVRVVHHKNQGKAKGAGFVRPHFYAADYYFYRKNYGFLFASVYLVMAKVHFYFVRGKLRREGQTDALILLEQAWVKLSRTRAAFRDKK